MIANAAARLITFFFAEQDLILSWNNAIRVNSRITAIYANGMQLGNRFGHGHDLGHGAKRTAFKIHIKACNNYADPLIGQYIANIGQRGIKKLSFVNSDHMYIARKQ